jgi:DUF1365 family protein
VTAAALVYDARVMHRRLFPVRYRFVYRVFSLLIDIDRVEEAAQHSALFSSEGFNLLSFHVRDHGPRDGTALRPWVEQHLAARGIDLAGGRIRLLCFPRVLGYGFNPLSIWYCEHADGSLRAVLCEVKNTFGEQHGYLLHDGGAAMSWPVRDEQDKCFHVSPFISMEAHYQFRLSAPEEALQVVIHEYQHGHLMLAAAQTGQARRFDTPTLLRMALAVPFMTLKVMTLIHWQALKIWLKGAPFFRKPEPPREEVTG